MAHKSYSASAPGSLMLMGEHAVLANKKALVCAVAKRITVTLIPSDNTEVVIHDQKLGQISQDISDLHVQEPFRFVLTAILLFKDEIRTGFKLHINSEFSSVLGLGSSAAVTAATIAVLANWLDAKPLAPRKVFKLAKQVITSVQKVGSGADLAASVFGGVLGYQQSPAKFIPLPLIPDLTAVYCGYKRPTVEVVAIVNAARQQQPKVFASLFNSMHVCVEQAIKAIKSSNWQLLGQLFGQHHGLQHAIGTSNFLLETLIHQLRSTPGIFGVKISGSGLGDCIIGLGKLDGQIFPLDAVQRQQGIQQIDIQIDQRGLIYAYE